MKVRTYSYLARQSLKAIKRNALMSMACILTVAISLFIFGAFLLLILNASAVVTSVESEVEIVAFLKPDVSEQVISEVGELLTSFPGVAQATLVTKEQALEELNQRFGESHDLLNALGGENPLSPYFRIRTQKPEEVVPLARRIQGLPYLEKVNYGQGVVEKLFAVVRWVRLLGTGGMIMLGLAAIILVAINTRLTVFSRRREIIIMKYVGATNWFIRWPFFLEGMLLGLAGALVAGSTLYFAYLLLVDNLRVTVPFFPWIEDRQLLWQIIGGLAGVGMALGALGSVFSVRRFLRV
ncbi:MAG: permease-like cell division protein FtsX [Bacillota bacterium]